MPQNYKDTIAEGDFKNLIAYLSSLK